jgi:hypothetical protein
LAFEAKRGLFNFFSFPLITAIFILLYVYLQTDFRQAE